MLGKGLQSLIPPQNGDGANNKPVPKTVDSSENPRSQPPQENQNTSAPATNGQIATGRSVPSPHWRPPSTRQNLNNDSTPQNINNDTPQNKDAGEDPISQMQSVAQNKTSPSLSSTTQYAHSTPASTPIDQPKPPTNTSPGATDNPSENNAPDPTYPETEKTEEAPAPFEHIEEVDTPASPSQHPPTETSPPQDKPTPQPKQDSKFTEKISDSHPVFQIETARIKSNPYQPREQYNEQELEELAASIREYGILQPLVVTRKEQSSPDGVRMEYELIAGERRLLAARKIGLTQVPAIVKEEPRDQREKLEMALIENIQRSNLNPLESARAYARLQDEFGLSQREVAQRLGKSRESVANTIRLLQLPREAQHALADGKITESHARILLQAQTPEEQRAVLSKIAEHGLSVRDTKALMTSSKTSSPKKTSRGELPDPQLEFVKKQLEESLGTPVKVARKGQKGKIVISFYSDEELQGLIDRLM